MADKTAIDINLSVPILSMEPKTITELTLYSKNNLSNFNNSQRNIYEQIDEKVNHFFKKGGLNIILLTGLRGVGKTIILKTIAKKYNGLYTSGDFLKANGISINNLMEITKINDQNIIIIDEILYLNDWQIKLKIEADTFQKTLFVISGSSAMQLKKISADLSRRLDIYQLNPFSFKEYLKIKHNIELKDKVNINQFTQKNTDKTYLELAKIQISLPKNIFTLFKQYYVEQLPFLLDEKDKENKMMQLIEKIIYKDMPQIDNLYAEHLQNAEIIIKFLASTEKLNYNTISTNLGLKKDIVIKIVSLFEKSEIISIIQDINPTRELRSNKKILFATPETRFALNQINTDRITGFAREDMFGLIMKIAKIEIAYNYNQDGFDYLARDIKFEIGNNKTNLKPGTIVIGDFTKLDLKKEVLYVPFYIFALIND
jgi:hypothetical protein